jgi:uncharacterized protein YggE
LQLYKEALTNAQFKAKDIAKNSGKRIGDVLSIVEGNVNTNDPVIFNSKASGMGGGGGTTIEPGTNTVSGTVTVVYELQNNLFGLSY